MRYGSSLSLLVLYFWPRWSILQLLLVRVTLIKNTFMLHYPIFNLMIIIQYVRVAWVSEVRTQSSEELEAGAGWWPVIEKKHNR